MTNYFDVVINGDNFYINEWPLKPNINDLALATLEKIELIVKNNLTYNHNHKDVYSPLSRDKLFDILKEKSSQIHNGYTKKQSELSWICRKIFSKEKKISVMHQKIDNYIKPPQILPLPNEAIQKIVKYLGFSDLGALAQLNHHGKTHTATSLAKRAKKFGYEGCNHVEGSKYIGDLFKEVNSLAKQEIIPKKFLALKGEKLDSERILQNLQNSSTDDIFTILSNKKIYSSYFQKFRKIFNIEKIWKLSRINDEPAKKKRSKALMLSAKKGDKKICEFLLHHGANINARDRKRRTALALATRAGQAEVVRLLTINGADVNTVNTWGNTPLLLASRHSTEISRLLLEAGAAATIDRTTNQGNQGNALHRAATWGRLETVELLLHHGANINARDQDGQTALARAALAGKTEVVRLLTINGADVNTVDRWGDTPLIFSLHHSTEISRLLLEAGATATIDRLNSKRDGGGNALHLAAVWGRLEAVELLLHHGANINARDQNGQIALARAALAGQIKVVRLLTRELQNSNLGQNPRLCPWFALVANCLSSD